ncbi:DinB family protein [Hymenobacter coccineus]|uniref:DinB-like domain-containing protein n=1 Tax=Hymenobacter coccineus TaxID=1908235 RepID=A0A1G1STV8_9BACT|nr:DinB family protein [Hymenobacter coccineus]OGX82077.1 hypothetical protein BEN49_02675 [Hymenobacter coccineus]
MDSTDRQSLFAQAFDTFKAFDNLTVSSSGAEQQAFPTTIWQILQHLLVWQTHQLAQLQGIAAAEGFDETRSWDMARVPSSEAALQAAVTQFQQQLVELQTWASGAKGDAQQVLTQGVILQDVALHLSFHLGEVVLMRRLQGSYPLPTHMREFLQA